MKYKPLIGASMSGSMGGLTASHNSGGAYFRTRVVPVNTNTPLQQTLRSAMSQLVAAWQGLSAVQRSAWNTYAANVPVTDAIGAAIKLSGQNMFVRSNVPRVQVGLAVVNTAPTIFNLGSLTAPVLIAAIGLTRNVQFSFTNSDAWATAVGGALLVYTSKPQSATINYFKGPYQFAGRINGAVAAPASPGNVTSPQALSAGQTVYVQMRATFSDGRLSAPWRGGIVVS